MSPKSFHAPRVLFTRSSLLLGLLILCGTIAQTSAKPARVILFRHAEKPEDEKDIHLSERGVKRAEALVEFFAANFGVDTNHPPVLFATRQTRGALSLRTRETLQPLAKALNFPIHQPVKAADFQILATHLLENPEFEGKTVVVCWAHDELGDFARALGADPKPKDWKKDVFDRVWEVSFKMRRVRCKTVHQQILPDDERVSTKHGEPEFKPGSEAR